MQVEPWAHSGGGLCSESHTDTVSVHSAPFHPNGHWQLRMDTVRHGGKLANAAIFFFPTALALCNCLFYGQMKPSHNTDGVQLNHKSDMRALKAQCVRFSRV